MDSTQKKKKKGLTHRNKITTLSSSGCISAVLCQLAPTPAAAAALQPRDRVIRGSTIQKQTPSLCSACSTLIYRRWVEEKFSHLFEALKCNFIYKLSIRFNAKFRLPCLSKTISEMESKKKMYIYI